jgi:ABC-2 type transport system ATP-binding protein
MFSTHQMTDVEELCDRVIMIDQGTVVLDDSLRDVKRRFRGDTLFIAADMAPTLQDGVTDIMQAGVGHNVRLQPGTTPEAVLSRLLTRGASIERFEVTIPSLEEIFLRMVQERRGST